jgi:peroxiredoxin
VITPQLEAFSRQMRKKLSLQFDLLTDQQLRLAGQFGLTFSLPQDLREVYQRFGVDLPRYNGDDSWRLPVPARYIIDRQSVIRYVAANPDYTMRPEPQETIDALQQLVTKAA